MIKILTQKLQGSRKIMVKNDVIKHYYNHSNGIFIYDFIIAY